MLTLQQVDKGDGTHTPQVAETVTLCFQTLKIIYGE